MSFKPDGKVRQQEKSVIAPFNADVVDRNQKWMQRRDEKLSRLILDQEKSVDAACSFRPNIVCLTEPDQARKGPPR
jgi:hypothetical protein